MPCSKEAVSHESTGNDVQFVMKKILPSILPLLLFALLVGCGEKAPEKKAASPWTHTIELGTEYYKGGPQQGSPPDGLIATGTKVKLIEGAGSYSLIEAETGENGYVSSGSLKPIE